MQGLLAEYADFARSSVETLGLWQSLCFCTTSVGQLRTHGKCWQLRPEGTLRKKKSEEEFLNHLSVTW